MSILYLLYESFLYIQRGAICLWWADELDDHKDKWVFTRKKLKELHSYLGGKCTLHDLEEECAQIRLDIHKPSAAIN